VLNHLEFVSKKSREENISLGNFSKSKDANIKVTAQKKNSFYLISIANNGIEIASEEKEKIFDLGYRGQNQVEGRSGSGFGLFLAKAILKKFAGKIEVNQLSENSEGQDKGMIFSLLLV